MIEAVATIFTINPPNLGERSIKAGVFFHGDVNFLVFGFTTFHWQIHNSGSESEFNFQNILMIFLILQNGVQLNL